MAVNTIKWGNSNVARTVWCFWLTACKYVSIFKEFATDYSNASFEQCRVVLVWHFYDQKCRQEGLSHRFSSRTKSTVLKYWDYFAQTISQYHFKGLHSHRLWVLGSDVSRSTATSFVCGVQQRKQRRTTLTKGGWRTLWSELCFCCVSRVSQFNVYDLMWQTLWVWHCGWALHITNNARLEQTTLYSLLKAYKDYYVHLSLFSILAK